MKKIIYLCALLLSQSVPAALIDFNDIAVGTVATGLNPYGDAVISTRLWVTEQGPIVAESFTRGVIDVYPYFPNGDSPAVVIGASAQDAPGDWSSSRWNIDIGVSFLVPVSTFSVDAYSAFYSTPLIYSGVNALGEAFTMSAGSLGGMPDRLDHFSITAPTGGYITGFHFSQFEDVGSIVLAMDNLDYTPFASESGLPTARVPEAIGLPTFIVTICGMLFAHRRMRLARK
jgi:hypothetical protein